MLESLTIRASAWTIQLGLSNAHFLTFSWCFSLSLFNIFFFWQRVKSLNNKMPIFIYWSWFSISTIQFLFRFKLLPLLDCHIWIYKDQYIIGFMHWHRHLHFPIFLFRIAQVQIVFTKNKDFVKKGLSCLRPLLYCHMWHSMDCLTDIC